MTDAGSSHDAPRLAEVVAIMSLVTDLATGQPLEHGLRRTVLAMRLAEELDLDGERASTAYYVAQLGTVGCTLEMATFAPYLADDIAVGEHIVHLDAARPRQMASFLLRHVGAGEPPLRRLRKLASVARAGPDWLNTVCRDVAVRVGDMIELGPAVQQALGQCHERWDGRGSPQRLRGEEVHVAARLFLVAHDVDIAYQIGGLGAVQETLDRRSGRQHDPRIAALMRRRAERWLPTLDAEVTWDAVLACEPPPLRRLLPADLDRMLRTAGDFVDMRTRYTLGHSTGVAGLAAEAASGLGFADRDVEVLRRAGFLHDLGAAGVPVATWDKEGALSDQEWARMRRHPALTELLLARSSALAPIGSLAGQHHERLDGSGYRQISAPFLSSGSQLLAAAELFRTKIEQRPHRRAYAPDAAAEEVTRQARDGRIDPQAADAVIEAAGHASPARGAAPRPAGLSERELEVLRLLARGHTNREMGELLAISPKTVGHHVQHIYDKIGVATRVGATLFSLHHGLVDAA